MKDYSKLLAKVNGRAKASVIRELLKLTNKPGLISFAGGMPDPTAFPSQDIADFMAKICKERPGVAFQYGQTEGDPEFKKEIIKLIKLEEGIDVTDEELLITTASQQSLDIVTKALVDDGDIILVGKPTYMGALQAFNSYGADMVGVESDDEGILPESLEEVLSKIQKAGKVCKFLYLVPDFQNPAGTTLTTARRQKILDIVKKYGTLVLEDSPYRKIRFEGETQTTFYALDKGEGNVITMFTFSKTFVPGLRLGYVIAHKELLRRFVILKQSMDLCTSPVCQSLANEFLKSGKYHTHVKKIIDIYAKKRDAMLAALKKYMPQGVKWTEPEGGLFLWVTVPEYIDCTKTLFPIAIEKNVAYVIGSAFFPDNSGHNTMRLNFSFASFEEIDEGIKRLAEAIKSCIK